MRLHKRGISIQSVDDWFRLAPPKGKEKQWKNYQSAKELARYWTEPPPSDALHPFEQLLTKFGNPVIATGEPECKSAIDNFRGEQPNCDLIMRVDSDAGTICIHVEAKADEPFSTRVGKQLENPKPGSNIPQRISALSSGLFGRPVDLELHALHYQLLYGAYATYLDSCRSAAAVGVFVVHLFDSQYIRGKNVVANAVAWSKFLRSFPELTAVNIVDGQLLGPVILAPDPMSSRQVPLYFAKIVTKLT